MAGPISFQTINHLSLFPDLIFFEYVFWAMDAQTQMQTE
jgi:hypothetical protein